MSSFLLAHSSLAYPGPHRGFDGMHIDLHTEAFTKNGYTWPPVTSTAGWPPTRTTFVESAAYRDTRDQIEAWIRRDIPDSKEKFDEFTNLVQSRMMPAFTPRGFQIGSFKELFPVLRHSQHATTLLLRTACFKCYRRRSGETCVACMPQRWKMLRCLRACAARRWTRLPVRFGQSSMTRRP